MSHDELIADQAALDRHLDALVHRYGQTSQNLVALTRRVGGAFPTEVLAAANRVFAGSIDPFPHGGGLGADEATTGTVDHGVIVQPSLAVGKSLLPVPHPLDFEWRFSDRGCETLVDFATSGLSLRGTALLGTPRFAEYLASKPNGLAPTLFELRPGPCDVLESLGVEVVQGDVTVTAPLHKERFQAVFADPPWYPAIVDGFIKAASALLAPAGDLFLCVPGLTTRPGLARERLDLLDSAASEGLLLQDIWSSSVEYEAPPFELSALRAAGLESFDPYWRRGDVLHFRHTPEAATPQTTRQLTMPPSSSHWTEVSIGRARFRVASKAVDLVKPGGSLFESVIPGDILDSVSTRDPRRSLANVWTTTNRIYRTDHPDELVGRLRELAAEIAGGAVSGTDPVSTAVSTELNELRHFGIE